MGKDNVNRLAAELGRSLCACPCGQCDLLTKDLGLCRTLIRLLASGQPVSPEALAEASGDSRRNVLAAIQASTNVELDGQGRIVGAGLSLVPTPYRLRVDGRLLYAWCALDALMYPPFLGMTATVESPCAATGVPIRLRVSSSGVDDVTPPQAVVSVAIPDSTCDVRQGFCHHIHFFRSAEDAERWPDRRPDLLLLSVAEAYDLGKQLTGMAGGQVD